MDGAFAVCMLVTLGFGAFIAWGRSASGRQALRQTLGEPTRRSQPSAAAKSGLTQRTAVKSSTRTAVKKSPNQNTSSRAASSPPAARKTSPTGSTSPQKPTGKPRSGSTPRSRKP